MSFIIPECVFGVNAAAFDVRVNNFWEKSNAGIEGPKLGAGFEQGCGTGEHAAGQTCGSMFVLEDAPIVISAEGFLDLLLGVFVV